MARMDPTSLRDMLAGRPCWYCRWWGGMANHVNGLCDAPGRPGVTAQPEHGCVFHEREPGVDDDLCEPVRIRPRLAPKSLT